MNIYIIMGNILSDSNDREEDLDELEELEETEKKYPGLIIGGNLRNGIGMADRILQGKRLADAAY